MANLHESARGEHLRLPAGFRYQSLDSSVHGFGAGISTAGSRVTISAADKNFAGFWLESTAASGTVRGIYMRLYFKGASAGGGETARFFSAVEGVTVGGGVHGAHITASLDATGQVSGLMAAVRATLGATAATKTVTGTLAALQVDSDVGANNTLPASCAFIRVADNSSVKLPYLFLIDTDGCLKGSAAGTTVQDAIKIRVNGT